MLDETADYRDVADYLVYDFWDWAGGKPRKHYDDHEHFGNDGVLTVRLVGLPERTHDLALRALEDWESVINLDFEIIDGPAQITIRHNQGFEARAFTVWDIRERPGEVFDNIWSSTVVVNDYFILLSDQRIYEVLLEEIGHALGLGHGGPYNGTVGDPIFAQDKHSVTVQSYERDLPIDGPQEADILAAELQYGDPGIINEGRTLHFVTDAAHSHLVDNDGYNILVWVTQQGGTLDLNRGASTDVASVGDDTYFDLVVVVGNSDEANLILPNDHPTLSFFL